MARSVRHTSVSRQGMFDTLQLVVNVPYTQQHRDGKFGSAQGMSDTLNECPICFSLSVELRGYSS
ncbi:MAG TPA: hypothetical protein VL866_23065 [Pyrinomonadaceae bacterium]|nr:hypothetical protein [Pyrinomonadaceae bacterium]